MALLILAYLGGILTILSPCVLPVVPFIFSRSDQPFRRSGLPLLIGMGLSFASFAALSVVGGAYVVQANQIGRSLALAVFAVLGLSLIFPKLAERLALPFVRLGGALQKRADARPGLGSSLLLGVAVGLLWAPCAGPILGLVLAGAAWGGSTQKTFGLLLVFAAGAASSLGLAIFAGGKVLGLLKKSLGAEEWIRRGIGAAVLGAAVAISLGVDTKILAKLSFFNTGNLEKTLIDQARPDPTSAGKSSALADQGAAPPLGGAVQWLNSQPLNLESLRGKVVLVDFWTYSCINCLRTLPYLKAWWERYHEQGLVVIGVHTPEFAFEKSVDNVRAAVADLGIKYPVAVDSDERIWSAFKNEYWPAHYLIDAQGRVRSHHFGEGGYDESERMIQALLSEAAGGRPQLAEPANAAAPIRGVGAEAPASGAEALSPETYLGYSRQEGFVSTPDIRKDTAVTYKTPARLSPNQWGLSGSWRVGPEMTRLSSSRGMLLVRFMARDLHLVIGAPRQRTIPFRVTIDGQAPQDWHGQDIDPNGYGKVTSHRLYQLIRQPEEPGKSTGYHTFQIEFFEPGAEVFAFTFG